MGASAQAQDIFFRHLQMSDFNSLWEYLSDEKATKYLTWTHYQEKTEAFKYLKLACSATEFPDEVLGVALKSTEQIVGTVHLIFRKTGGIQFGFGIGRKFWGRGIGNQVVRKSIDYLSSNTKWASYTIWADVHVHNDVAIRVLKQNDFSLMQELIEPNRNRYAYIR